MLDQQNDLECHPKRGVRTNNFMLSDDADVRAPSMHCSINHVLMIRKLLFRVFMMLLFFFSVSNVSSRIQKHHSSLQK